MEIEKGKIIAFQGSWSSGLATLLIETEEGVQSVLCDNGPTARALISAFNCLGPGHTIDNSKLEGQEISFSVDFLGLLEGFSPI